jgi:hypothetical protein
MEFWDILNFMAALGGLGGAHHDARVAASDDLAGADLRRLAGFHDAAHAHAALGHEHLARAAAVAHAGGLEQLVDFNIGAAFGKREFDDGHVAPGG